MNRRRIVVTAVAAAVLPLGIGILFGMAGGLFDVDGSTILVSVRVWTIRLLLTVLFTWLAVVQRQRPVAHAAIAAVSGWALAEVLKALALAVLAPLAERGGLPEVPSWSPDGWHLLELLVLAALGLVCGRFVRRPARAERRTP